MQSLLVVRALVGGGVNMANGVNMAKAHNKRVNTWVIWKHRTNIKRVDEVLGWVCEVSS